MLNHLFSKAFSTPLLVITNKDMCNRLLNLLYILIYTTYTILCIKIVGYNNIEFNFNLSDNLSSLYFYSYNKYALASALLLFIFIPCSRYLFTIIVCFICDNYKLVVIILFGIYSIYKLINILDSDYTINNNSKFNIVDNLLIRAISIIIIALIILVVLSIIGIQYNIFFMNLFILASHGIFIHVGNTVRSLYHKYKEGNSLSLYDYNNNYYSKTSIILIILIRYMYTNILYYIADTNDFFYWLPLWFIIFILIAICYYIVYREELHKELTLKSILILLLCLILFFIIRIITIYVQHSDTLFDMVKWFDNNDNVGRSSRDQERANFVPRRLSDLGDIDIPVRPNRSIIPSITSIRSSWDSVSSTIGIRNSSIVNYGLNHNHHTHNQLINNNRLNVQPSFNSRPSQIFNPNSVLHSSQRIVASSSSTNNLVPQTQVTQPIVASSSNTNNLVPQGEVTQPIVVSNNNANNLALQDQITQPVSDNNTVNELILTKLETPGNIEYVEAPNSEDIEYAIQHDLPIKKWIGTYETRFSNSFIDTKSLIEESHTPPTPSSPVERDWMYYEYVPDSRVNELVPEVERVPSPVRRFTKHEIWDRLHEHPIKDHYESGGDTYLPNDRLPTRARLDVYNGFIIYDRINGKFSWSGLDWNEWHWKFIERHGTLVTD